MKPRRVGYVFAMPSVALPTLRGCPNEGAYMHTHIVTRDWEILPEAPIACKSLDEAYDVLLRILKQMQVHNPNASFMAIGHVAGAVNSITDHRGSSASIWSVKDSL